MSQANRKKRKGAPITFDWQPLAADDDPFQPTPGPDIRVSHTNIGLDPNGPSSSRISFLSAPASPAKRSSITAQHYAFNSTTTTTALQDALDPAATAEDPAYTHHKDLHATGAPLRRKRTAVVCIIKNPVCMVLMFYVLYRKPIQFTNGKTTSTFFCRS